MLTAPPSVSTGKRPGSVIFSTGAHLDQPERTQISTWESASGPNGSPWKPLAANELAHGAPAIELADGWWDLAQREEEPARRQLQIHAAGWYRQALSALDAAATARAQARIAEVPPEPRGRL